jgi:proteasome lid subunit RPN8/RPN11
LSTLFRLRIPTPLLQEIYGHAQAELPNECCGMLAGKLGTDGVVVAERRYALVNEKASPKEFLSEPSSMFRADRDRRAAGLEFVAVYHSHPTSEAKPSTKDLENNYSEKVMNLIVSLETGEPVMRGWWLTATRAEEGEWEEAS